MAYSIQFAALTALSFLVFLLTIILYTHLALDAHPTSDHASNRDVVSPHAIIGDKEEAIIEALWPEDGQDTTFFMSLNSCVDGCGPSSQDKSSSNNEQKKLKVGLLAPPGRMSRAFFSFCKQLAQQISKQPAGKGQESDTIHWIPTHHLPFTSNEYTHIIRFANVPLLLATGDALQTMVTTSQVPASDVSQIVWQDINETTKLLVSWHCQISNLVDEGTVPLVTISMEELEQDSYEQENMLMSFLTSSTTEENDMGGADGSGDGNIEPTFDESFIKETIGNIKPMLKQVNRVLLKEMNKGLVTLTKQTIKQSLHGVQGCPSEAGLWHPSRPLPRMLYSFLKTGKVEDDLALCDGHNAAMAICTMLEEARAQVLDITPSP
ncbi:unnamed protein product [Cylindrotheca closterium]|uniref:Uncharacterized protein n=1 Tax=Cylindrotheca closterium TaxID=2856 RepID=A0AAD2CLL6_9STRA|nr:unnamed protein product [Cylindrotheca closterium]